MQMEAHGERSAGTSGQPVFAAQVVTVCGQKQLAGVDQAKAIPIPVMGRRDPLLSVVLGSFAGNSCWRAAQDAVVADLSRVSVGDDEHRMRGARAGDAPPVRLGAAISAAIYNDPLSLVAHLKGQR